MAAVPFSILARPTSSPSKQAALQDRARNPIDFFGGTLR